MRTEIKELKAVIEDGKSGTRMKDEDAEDIRLCVAEKVSLYVF